MTPSPTPSSIGASPSPTPASGSEESPEGFFDLFGRALANGDEGLLFSRLHPLVFERYARAACRAYLGGLEVPAYEVEVLAVEGTERFVYETDDLRRRVPGSTAVRVRFTEDGGTFVETTAHIVLDRGRYLWFTDCGTPLAGAA